MTIVSNSIRKMNLKDKLIILLLFLLIGCASMPANAKCVNVAYFDYGDKGIFQHLYWFEGYFYDEPFWEYKGMVLVNKYIGEGSASILEKKGCKNLLNIPEGFYSVHIPDGLSNPEKQKQCVPGWCGVHILRGEGWQTWGIVVSPNYIPQKHLKQIIGKI